MNRPIDTDLDDNPRIPASWSREKIASELRAERRRCAEVITENRKLKLEIARIIVPDDDGKQPIKRGGPPDYRDAGW
jgi:hypothetical protein